MAVPFDETKIAQGGLMRCCIQSILDYGESGQPCTPGETVIECQYEKDGPTVIALEADGVWRWQRHWA